MILKCDALHHLPHNEVILNSTVKWLIHFHPLGWLGLQVSEEHQGVAPMSRDCAQLDVVEVRGRDAWNVSHCQAATVQLVPELKPRLCVVLFIRETLLLKASCSRDPLTEN